MAPQPVETLKGFGVTFKQIFKKPLTEQYPEYKRPIYPRFRGRHRLWTHANGLEKCVGCSLCAAACPADCIRVVPAETTPDNRVSAGERYARIYEINMSRCSFCGYSRLPRPFVTAAQVLVYAGVVMVMFLFVIAYVGPRTDPPWESGPRWQTLAAVLAAAAIFLEIIVVIGLKAGGGLSHTDHVHRVFGSPGWI